MTGIAGSTIETQDDVRRGVQALVARCPLLEAAALRHPETAGDPPLRRLPGGFPGIARVVIGQQVSVASARAIWERFEAALAQTTAGVTPEAFLALPLDARRAIGLSRTKSETLDRVANAVTADRVLAQALAEPASRPGLDDDAVRTTLTAIKGIGRWTVDVYIMFCVGRTDGFASGDLALQSAYGALAGVSDRPKAEALEVAAEAWRPWRGVAARMLWAYYGAEKAQSVRGQRAERSTDPALSTV